MRDEWFWFSFFLENIVLPLLLQRNIRPNLHTNLTYIEIPITFHMDAIGKETMLQLKATQPQNGKKKTKNKKIKCF